MSVLIGRAPMPMTDAIARARRTDQFKPGQADPLEGLIGDKWAEWLSQLATNVGKASTVIATLSLTSQPDAIATSDLVPGGLKAGLYRITYHARVTTPATTSSSLEVALGWTDGGVAQLQTGTAIVGNTTASLGSQMWLFHLDANASITYETIYASVGATRMQYRLDLALEVIAA